MPPAIDFASVILLIGAAQCGFFAVALIGRGGPRQANRLLALQYRARVFDPLGLQQTYLEWYEPALGAGPAHHFIDLDSLGVGGVGNADVIALGINTSLDWAGGGVGLYDGRSRCVHARIVHGPTVS